MEERNFIYIYTKVVINSRKISKKFLFSPPFRYPHTSPEIPWKFKVFLKRNRKIMHQQRRLKTTRITINFQGSVKRIFKLSTCKNNRAITIDDPRPTIESAFSPMVVETVSSSPRTDITWTRAASPINGNRDISWCKEWGERFLRL